ncbi:DUF4232 domain-containing protein [Streptomyces monticola]|uniref:DUF4232 domain-containing protein n=1 Tax=Streptomyces monticola TaxID=2666263 RepID=A0ABW2JEE6_9ACTN
MRARNARNTRTIRNTRTATALFTGALLLTATGAGTGTAAAAPDALPTCREGKVRVAATGAATEPGSPTTVLRIKVTNTGPRACAVDRVPTVTFGELDGAAQPVPVTQSAPYELAAGRSAYAAVRTIADPADANARKVDYVTAAADPSHRGARFSAAELGSADGVRVWEPVTSWWHRTQAAADRALAAGTVH